MRLLVSGTRHQPLYLKDLVRDELDLYFDKHGNDLFLILGDARGVDTYAREWAEMRKVDHVVLYAIWEKHYKAAGPIRNRKMIDQGPDEAIVFLAPDSKGTANMVKQLEKEGIEPKRIDVAL